MTAKRYQHFCKLSGFTVKAMNVLLQKTPNINSVVPFDNKSKTS